MFLLAHTQFVDGSAKVMLCIYFHCFKMSVLDGRHAVKRNADFRALSFCFTSWMFFIFCEMHNFLKEFRRLKLPSLRGILIELVALCFFFFSQLFFFMAWGDLSEVCDLDKEQVVAIWTLVPREFNGKRGYIEESNSFQDGQIEVVY